MGSSYPLITGQYSAIPTATTVGYGGVTPHHVATCSTGAAAAAGIRRFLPMGHGLSASVRPKVHLIRGDPVKRTASRAARPASRR